MSEERILKLEEFSRKQIELAEIQTDFLNLAASQLRALTVIVTNLLAVLPDYEHKMIRVAAIDCLSQLPLCDLSVQAVEAMMNEKGIECTLSDSTPFCFN